MGKLTFQIGLLLAVCSSRLCVAAVSVSLDENLRFVVHGQGEELSGIHFQSSSGALVPVPGSPPPADPFSFLLSNTPNSIVYGSIPRGVTVDGSLPLFAGWDPQVGTRDVQVEWGERTNPVPHPAVLEYGPCEQCPAPLLGVAVNADRRVVLTGVGQPLSQMTFRSASGSLIPADVPTPFATTLVNTPSEVQFVSTDPVTIDGAVTLGLGWSDRVYTRDIRYEYTIFDAEMVGPTPIRTSDYDYQLPQFPRMDVQVTDDFQILIKGEELPLTRLEISSPTGALVPGGEAGTFGTVSDSTPHRVAFEPAGDMLVLDGEVTLPTGWDPLGREDLFISYDLVGDLRNERYSVPSTAYPEVPQYIKLGVDPILITLDDQNRFVITGTGQQISGIEFKSEAGLLTTSQQGTAPFPLVLSNTPNEVTVGILETPAEVLGSYVMDFGITSADALEDISIAVGYGSVAVPLESHIVCATCDLPTVSISDDRELIFRDFPERIMEIRFTSKDGGLESLELPPGITLTQTDTEVLIESPDGFGPETLHGLAVAWGVVSDQQVFVSYTLPEGVTFGPLPLSLGVAEVVPEPQAAVLLLVASLWVFRLRRGEGALGYVGRAPVATGHGPRTGRGIDCPTRPEMYNSASLTTRPV